MVARDREPAQPTSDSRTVAAEEENYIDPNDLPEAWGTAFPDGRWAAEISAEVRSLRDGLERMQHTLQLHQEYHTTMEHRWGLARLVERYPMRALSGVAILVLLLRSGVDAPTIVQIIKELLH